jgi:hypothetical protein
MKCADKNRESKEKPSNYRFLHFLKIKGTVAREIFGLSFFMDSHYMSPDSRLNGFQFFFLSRSFSCFLMNSKEVFEGSKNNRLIQEILWPALNFMNYF